MVYLAGFLQLLAPGIAARILDVARMAWDAGKWGEIRDPLLGPRFPDPLQCGMRTIEHLSYDSWKNLGDHEDGGSLYTVLIALSDPADYVGGRFGIEYTTSSQRHKRFETKPQIFSAMVFHSECQHGVRELGSPGRVTFATELWNLGDVAVGGLRPSKSEFEDFQETGVWGDGAESDDKYGGEGRDAKEDEDEDEEEEDEEDENEEEKDEDDEDEDEDDEDEDEDEGDEDEGEDEGEHENES